MTKNQNEKVPFVTIVLVVAVVLGVAYFLFTTAPKPQTSQVARTTNVAAQNDMASHHGGVSTGVNDTLLNSLVGKAMPEIELKDKNGKTYTNADFKGKYTVLFFNEGLMCYPGCWNQIAAFGGDERFDSASVQAVSVVVDSPVDWQKAIQKMPKLADANTMFDNGAKASSKLGMLATASSMHRGSLPGHTYVLLDKEGVVKFVWDDPRMSIANDLLWNKIQELNK